MSEIMPSSGQYLTFILNKEHYGIPIETVREINQLMPITPMPNSPSYVAGVINLRGKVIPVLDLRAKLELKINKTTRETCIIVIDQAEKQVGAIVDGVRDVVILNTDQIDSTPKVSKQDTSFISGVGKLDEQILLLLDVDKTLSIDELEAEPISEAG